MIFAGRGNQISKTNLPHALLGCVIDTCYRSKYIYIYIYKEGIYSTGI